jgi:hypothetical protein
MTFPALLPATFEALIALRINTVVFWNMMPAASLVMGTLLPK